MNVLGTVVTDEQIDAAIAALRKQKHFVSQTLAGFLQDQGVPFFVASNSIFTKREWVASEASNRILQKLRKAGAIARINGNTWKWTDK